MRRRPAGQVGPGRRMRKCTAIPLAVAAGAFVGMAAAASVLAGLLRHAQRKASAPVRNAADLLSPSNDGLPPAHAIVVLGATADKHGPCAELRARLDHAASLWRLGVAPLVLVTGGVNDAVDEVQAMADYLGRVGVAPAAISQLRPGRTTRESLRTLRERGAGPYVLVSSPYHALRIRAEARRQGLRVVVSAPASTPETRCAAAYRVRFVSELIALAWYALPATWTGRVSTRPGTLRHVGPDVLMGQAPLRQLLTVLRGGSS